jgi:hypothetical protein
VKLFLHVRARPAGGSGGPSLYVKKKRMPRATWFSCTTHHHHGHKQHGDHRYRLGHDDHRHDSHHRDHHAVIIGRGLIITTTTTTITIKSSGKAEG